VRVQSFRFQLTHARPHLHPSFITIQSYFLCPSSPPPTQRLAPTPPPPPPFFPQAHHGVHITDAALVAAVAHARRYMVERRLPDSAIDLLDEVRAPSHDGSTQ
jgi:hypothetical protein